MKPTKVAQYLVLDKLPCQLVGQNAPARPFKVLGVSLAKRTGREVELNGDLSGPIEPWFVVLIEYSVDSIGLTYGTYNEQIVTNTQEFYAALTANRKPVFPFTMAVRDAVLDAVAEFLGEIK